MSLTFSLSAGSVFTDATSLGGVIATKVTCKREYSSLASLYSNSSPAIGGSLATVVTSEGGQAITLATSGAGRVTSFAGATYTALVDG